MACSLASSHSYRLPVSNEQPLCRTRFTNGRFIEPQPTSSRWRALTHRSIRTLYPGLEEYAISELVTTMLRWSAAVFTVSGCSSSQVGDKNAVPANLRAQLRRIAEAVYKLAKVTREDILSTSFEVMLIESGGSFDNVDMMNAFPEFNAQSNPTVGDDRVLCTTELGLKCVTRKSKTTPSAEADGDVLERRTLLHPKVVLDSAVDALEHE